MDERQARIPPQNTEAEASLLGAVLIDADAIVKIADTVAPSDFYDERHRRIYEAAQQLYEKHRPIDVLTLSDQLKGAGLLDMVGGASYLTELTNFVPTAAHVEQYAEIVAEKAMRRKLIKASQDIVGLSFDEAQSLKQLIEEAEARLFEVSGQHIKQDITSLETILAESFDRLDELHKDKGKIRGVPTGYKDLDNILAGLQRSDLFVLAARPSMGKTALALNIAHNVALKSELPVLMFSLEMSKEQLVDRMLAMESGVDAWALRTGNLTDADFEKIGQAMGALSEAQIYIDDTPGITVSDLRTKARREAHQRPLGLVIVDYLQLMSGGFRFGSEGNRVQEISEISRGLKGIARELNVPLMALSQLSRSVESRSPQIPQLADLRESGCLTGDTLITLADSGLRVPIRDLVGKSDFHVWALNPKTLKIEAARVSNAFPTGRKAVYKLTTRLGRKIRATGNHKFYTIDGWRRLDELTAGDRLALPRRIQSNQKDSMTLAEAALLGHLIGDGCTLPRHVIQYTTRELDLAEKVVELARVVFGEQLKPRINPERQWYQVYLSAAQRLTHSKRNPVAKWLDDVGAFGLRSYEKRIPDLVFRQPEQTLGVFLKHLWATDGCILPSSNPGRHPAIYYATSSVGLAHDVQSLLLRLGINAVLRPRSQGIKGRMQYHVMVMGKEDILTFARQVGAVGAYKTAALAKCVERVNNYTSNTNRDVIPNTIWRSYAVPMAQANGVTSRQLQSSLGMAYMGTGLYKQNISRERTDRLAVTISGSQPDEHLAVLAASDIYWDSILSIETGGEEEVFDLTVPGPSNFVADDIVVHNSIEQDADVVAFIYREDYYNPETDRKSITDIFIKKHRNGPTGGVELYFEKEKQRFRSLDTKHSTPFDT